MLTSRTLSLQKRLAFPSRHGEVLHSSPPQAACPCSRQHCSSGADENSLDLVEHTSRHVLLEHLLAHIRVILPLLLCRPLIVFPV
jgi:hypothetical protein